MGTSRAAAAALFVCLWAAGGCSAGQEPTADPSITSVPMPAGDLPPRVPVLATGCPGPEVAPHFPPGGRLPSGAIRLRVCNAAGDEWVVRGRRHEQDYRVPLDALTTQVDSVVRLVNAGTPAPEEGICAGVGGPGQVLWFSYPDTDLAVTVHDGGCADLDRGDARVHGGDVVVAELSRLLWAQRDARPPPRVSLEAACSPALTRDTPLVLTDRLDVVDAVVCEFTDEVRQARLGADELAAMNAEFRAQEDRRDPPGCETRLLRGVTAWGDRFSWLGSCWDFAIPGAYPRGLHWEPTPQLRAALDAVPLGPPRRQDLRVPGRR